ncbi:MAG: hypothetical protein OXH76_21730, partial [Boseongicola sp.]|nr:hypothetical protein [Boseongicola sp.]
RTSPSHKSSGIDRIPVRNTGDAQDCGSAMYVQPDCGKTRRLDLSNAILPAQGGDRTKTSSGMTRPSMMVPERSVRDAGAR